MKFRHPLAAAAVALLACTAPAAVHAQAFPAKPVRLVLPFPPGGGTDILGRMLAQRLGESYGQTVIAENRPGAGGNVGAEFTARQPPDGYTIVLCSPSISISPSLYKKLNYDPLKDLAPIGLVASIPNLLVVHPSVPARSVQELIALARKSPGKLNFGSGGAGTTLTSAGTGEVNARRARSIRSPPAGAGGPCGRLHPRACGPWPTAAVPRPGPG